MATASTEPVPTPPTQSDLEEVRVELHQRIAIHEQETVTLKTNAAAAELKNAELILETQKLLDELKELKEQVTNMKVEVLDERARNTKVRKDSEDEREQKEEEKRRKEKETPDWQKKFENDLKPNQELGGDQKKFEEWKRKMESHVGSGSRKLVEYLKWLRQNRNLSRKIDSKQLQTKLTWNYLSCCSGTLKSVLQSVQK